MYEQLIEFKGKGKKRTSLLGYVQTDSNTSNQSENQIKSFTVNKVDDEENISNYKKNNASELPLKNEKRSMSAEKKKISEKSDSEVKLNHKKGNTSKEKCGFKKPIINHKSISEYFVKTSTSSSTPNIQNPTADKSKETKKTEVADINKGDEPLKSVAKEQQQLDSFREKTLQNIDLKLSDNCDPKSAKRKRSIESVTNMVGEVKKQKNNCVNMNSKVEDLFGGSDVKSSLTVHCKSRETILIDKEEMKSQKSKEEKTDIFKLKFSTKDRARISDLVVKNLMPIYRKKDVITTKEQFKSIAKEISKFLLESHGPKISKFFFQALRLYISKPHKKKKNWNILLLSKENKNKLVYSYKIRSIERKNNKFKS